MLKCAILGISKISETRFTSTNSAPATLLPAAGDELSSAEGNLLEPSPGEPAASGEALPGADASEALLLPGTGQPPAREGGCPPDTTPRPGLRPSRPPPLTAGSRPPPGRRGRRGPRTAPPATAAARPSPPRPAAGPAGAGSGSRGATPARRRQGAVELTAGRRLPLPAPRRARAPAAQAAPPPLPTAALTLSGAAATAQAPAPRHVT